MRIVRHSRGETARLAGLRGVDAVEKQRRIDVRDWQSPDLCTRLLPETTLVRIQHRAPKFMKTFKSPAIHRTPLYRAKAAYCNMIARCENANGKNPAYANVKLRMSLDEFLAWAVPRYEAFVAEYPNERPVCARRGDLGDYEIGNIEIISWAENRKRQKTLLQLREDGTKMCGRCRKILIAVANFRKNRWRPDGFGHWCRECCKEYLEA